MLFSLNSFHCSSYITPTWPIYGLGHTCALRSFFTLLLGSLDYDVSMIVDLDGPDYRPIQFGHCYATVVPDPLIANKKARRMRVERDLQIWE